MNSVMKTISKNNKEIIIDNNFLFTAFQNRLSSRIVHIFDKENRLLYDLERLWRDGKEVDVNSL